MKLLSLIVIGLLFPISVRAESDKSVTVKQFFSDKGRAVTQANPSSAPASEYVATMPDGHQCSMRVIERRDDLLVLDTKNCKEPLKAGQILEPSLLSDQGVGNVPLEAKETNQGFDYDKSNLQNIFVLPREGRIFGRISWEYHEVKNRVDYRGKSFSTLDRNTKATPINIQYGMTDNTAVSVGISNFWPDERETNYGPASIYNSRRDISESQGLTDPTLGIDSRLADQVESTVNCFLHVAITPSIIKAKTATTVTNGNEGAGGTKGTVGISITKEFAKIGVGGRLQYSASDKRVSESATSSDERIEETGGEGTDIALETAIRFTNSVSLNLELEYSMLRPTKIKYLSSGVEQNTSEATYSTFFGGVSVVVIPEVAVLSGGYGALTAASSKVKVDNVELDRSVSGGAFILRGLYAF